MSKANSFRVCSVVSRYHKAKRGGNKSINDKLISAINERKDINNVLLGLPPTAHNTNNKKLTIMEKKNLSMSNSIAEYFNTRVADAARRLYLSALINYLHKEDDELVTAEGVRLLVNEFAHMTKGLRLVSLTASNKDGLTLVSSANEVLHPEKGKTNYISFSVTRTINKSKEDGTKEKVTIQTNRLDLGLLPQRLNGLTTQIVMTTWKNFLSYIKGLYNADKDTAVKFRLCDSLLANEKGGRTAATDSEKEEKRINKVTGNMSVVEKAIKVNGLSGVGLVASVLGGYMVAKIVPADVAKELKLAVTADEWNQGFTPFSTLLTIEGEKEDTK